MPTSSIARSFAKRLFGALAAVTLALLAIPSFTASTANAAQVPFWEEADAAAKAVKRKGKYAKSSRKSYGASSYGKKRKTTSLSGDWFGSSGGSLTGGGGKIRWAANSGCLDPGLRAVINAGQDMAVKINHKSRLRLQNELAVCPWSAPRMTVHRLPANHDNCEASAL